MMIINKEHRLSLIKKLTFTSLMLTLVLLFNYLERFIPLNFGFLKFNISLLFILPTFYLCGFKYGLILFISRYLIGTALVGFNILSLLSQMILLSSELIAVICLYLFSFLFRSKYLSYSFYRKNIIILILTLITASLINTALNVLIFFPLFISVLTDFTIKPWVMQVANFYSENLRMLFFGISNYWVGTTFVYLLGNLLKFSLVFGLYYLLYKVLYQLKQNSFYQ